MTNGFDLTKVINALHSRIGWRQPAATGAPQITTTNKTTTSGRYFQDFHALVTVDNVKKTMEESNASDINLNAKLTELTNAAIMRCVNAVFRVKDFLEHAVVMQPTAQQPVRTIPNTGLFVGLEINMAKATDIIVQLDTAQLLFDTSTTFNLYLFAEGKKEPVYTISTVSSLGGEVAHITLTDVLLSYISTNYQASRFWIGYFQEDVAPAEAIQQDVCFEPTKVFGVQAMQAPRDGSNNDFKRDQISYTSQLQGLNLEISAFRDHTQQIVKNPSLFDEAIGLTMAYMVIEQILNSTQSNATERILKDGMASVAAQMELTGVAPITDGPPKIKGLSARIDEELKKVRSMIYPKPKAQVVNYACH
jgi:hypothetical protein